MKLEQQDYLVGISILNGIAGNRFAQLVERFQTPQKIWQASKKSLLTTGLNKNLVERFISYRSQTNLYSLKIWLRKELIQVLTIDNKNYPKLLKEISNPPFLIFIKTAINLQKIWNKRHLIAVIGSRQMTNYGRASAQQLTTGLVKNGWLIVSGLARGIDGVAHQTALDSGGQTLAVLGHGLDKIYPPEHLGLAEKIIRQGALITEYPPFLPARKNNFPMRNRIIAGLSQAVLVIEAKKRSGTKITAGFAADFGREVLAVPGQIDSPASAGSADLIKQGAKLVYCLKDILEELT